VGIHSGPTLQKMKINGNDDMMSQVSQTYSNVLSEEYTMCAVIVMMSL